MAVSFATIALPDLLHAPEGLSLDETQASWFGSLSYLTQPLGAIVSGPIVDYFGRKKANFLVNIPHLIAWVLMYNAWNLPSLFIANGLLGFGSGVMEAPINSYVGEISEPSIRGALCTVTQLFSSVGMFVIYFLGTVVSWRQAALICLAAPISSMLLVLLTSVTSRPVAAVLCTVTQLFSSVGMFVIYFLGTVVSWRQAALICLAALNISIVYLPLLFTRLDISRERQGRVRPTDSLFEETAALCHLREDRTRRRETLRPLTLVMMYFMFFVMSGLSPIRPNMVNVCGAFGMAGDPKNIVLMVGVILFLAAVVIIGIIKLAGKRKLALSVYAKIYIPGTVFSYDTSTFPTETSVVPLVSRASAQGVAAAWNYVVMFLGSKTFINLETSFQLWGAFAVYAAFGFAGTAYLYFFMPETEGKSLQDIEGYYNGEFRTFADDPVINTFKRFKKKS
ncbi:Sugar transporter [Operophtera brumata]|uniref:Sugar transporter n=1 Tax=Operophtera brumata TaxID=104452 RepID=A0A0L7KQ05_OPEBR|nr:Sugar transporter [Operophtera brumata]